MSGAPKMRSPLSVPVKFSAGPTVPNPLLNQSGRPGAKLERCLFGSWLQPQEVTQAVGQCDAATVSRLNKQTNNRAPPQPHHPHQRIKCKATLRTLSIHIYIYNTHIQFIPADHMQIITITKAQVLNS